jgi:hypothetical protein
MNCAMSRPAVQIDPVGCRCTECLTHEYVPLDLASAADVFALIKGELGNATGERFIVATETGSMFDPVTIEMVSVTSGITWTYMFAPPI